MENRGTLVRIYVKGVGPANVHGVRTEDVRCRVKRDLGIESIVHCDFIIIVVNCNLTIVTYFSIQ